jgi:uncharacterized protein YqgV (UPF0045/DUF77 family)
MGVLSAQVSIYPLRQKSIGLPVREAIRVFHRDGLETRTGRMSTLVWGEEQAVFAALHEAFDKAAAHGDVVMIVTLSSACPSPGEPPSEL